MLLSTEDTENFDPNHAPHSTQTLLDALPHDDFDTAWVVQREVANAAGLIPQARQNLAPAFDELPVGGPYLPDPERELQPRWSAF